MKLRRADCDDEGIHVVVGKTGVRVCVLWSDRLRAAHQRALALHENVASMWLIPTTRGQRYSIDGYGDLFAEVMKDWIAAGNEHFRPHDLRAGGATKLLNEGHTASDTTGHKLESTLKRHYDRPAERRGKPAA
ncbi:MAG: tyrosine-type recombinase/integrase [Rhodocyclaceae bacterium]|nr:tyrosine-type recombinase/integrase [Rhodocyclaceae bacterium]